MSAPNNGGHARKALRKLEATRRAKRYTYKGRPITPGSVDPNRRRHPSYFVA